LRNFEHGLNASSGKIYLILTVLMIVRVTSSIAFNYIRSNPDNALADLQNIFPFSLHIEESAPVRVRSLYRVCAFGGHKGLIS
jgi:hypothetical protein